MHSDNVSGSVGLLMAGDTLLTLACVHAQRGLLQLVVSVRLYTVFLGNRGNSERETWTYYQVGGMHGKIRFWSGEGRGSGRNGGLPR